MPDYPDESEKDFREWIDSIQFVDKDWKPVTLELLPDDSPDPEGDRNEDEEV